MRRLTRTAPLLALAALVAAGCANEPTPASPPTAAATPVVVDLAVTPATDRELTAMRVMRQDGYGLPVDESFLRVMRGVCDSLRDGTPRTVVATALRSNWGFSATEAAEFTRNAAIGSGCRDDYLQALD